MRIKIRPYKMASESAKAIAQALPAKRLRQHTRYIPSANTLVLNWGGSAQVNTRGKVINQPTAVAKASNKLTAFQVFKNAGVVTPEFTSDKNVAQTWLVAGHKVVERHKLNGTNGEGIVIIQPGEQLNYAPLYVKYQKKDKEYRVHVFNGKVIDVTEKRKRAGVEGRNQFVRNLQNGWVYCRANVFASDVVKNEAIKAVASLGLDFGAVDVIEKHGKAYILEVNCAPGLVGATLDKYVEAIRGAANNATPTRRYSSY